MTAAEIKIIYEEDKWIRKWWTDLQWNQHLKKNAVGTPPHDRLGCDSDLLCTMVEVEGFPLCVGHMYSTKDIFWMRIGELGGTITKYTC
jgi:hypothetical protein